MHSLWGLTGLQKHAEFVSCRHPVRPHLTALRQSYRVSTAPLDSWVDWVTYILSNLVQVDLHFAGLVLDCVLA
jgi:hypothetical protein